MALKKKELEIILQGIPSPPLPSPRLEQYTTPAAIAADILYIAHGFGDIEGKKVIDLGCGTGIFALGAAILGAEKVTGLDIDAISVKIAKKKADELGLNNVSFLSRDVKNFDGNFDTVLQNPPFGAQKKGADIPFLMKAIEIAPVTFTIHNTVTSDFVRKKVIDSGNVITFEKNYKFEIKYMFRFHRKERVKIEVTMFRIERR